MRKIKLIWDFRGPSGEKTAEHHEIHLKEFIQREKIDAIATGFEVISEVHAIAFLAIEEKHMLMVRDALRPHRGELWEG